MQIRISSCSPKNVLNATRLTTPARTAANQQLKIRPPLIPFFCHSDTPTTTNSTKTPKHLSYVRPVVFSEVPTRSCIKRKYCDNHPPRPASDFLGNNLDCNRVICFTSSLLLGGSFDKLISACKFPRLHDNELVIIYAKFAYTITSSLSRGNLHAEMSLSQ